MSHRAEPNKLLPYIGKSDFAQGVLARIESEGFIVLRNVFSPDEVAAEYNRMWRWVETVSKGIKRSDPSTWQRRGGQDPWPCKQRDMMQMHHAGWIFNDLREHMADRVFEKLYDSRELHCSKDGFTLQRPTERDLNPPANDHFDQGSALRGLQCIQGSVALTDQAYEDGCFLCWPGSHKYHDAIMSWRRGKGGRQNFVILNSNEKAWLEEMGIRPLRVPVNKGDVILWRSDLVHKGTPPIGRRDNFRAVVYICMMPAALTPEHVYLEKQRAFDQLQTGSHWPCEEEWFSSRDPPRFALLPYYRAPPELTARQRLLYGLDRYGNEGLQASIPIRENNASTSTRIRRWTKQKNDHATNEENDLDARRAPQSQVQDNLDDQETKASPVSFGCMDSCLDGALVADDSIIKEERKLRKALREIEELERQQRDGQKLRTNQLVKIEKKADVDNRLRALELTRKET
eukprot:TRINITY_DN26824_c0_g1_i1.p1 TRINITY_DN26824_c0_g1~~TRINITY_DN26824_c0_g1_i1.p1  ORF type:complete len:459 (-),score=58.17 TRINITY_DN26824_c0_g1_i1:278-1654(-)